MLYKEQNANTNRQSESNKKAGMKKEISPLWYWTVCKNNLSYIRMRTHNKEGWERYFKRLNEPKNKRVLKEVFSNKRILKYSKKENPKELKILQKEVLK